MEMMIHQWKAHTWMAIYACVFEIVFGTCVVAFIKMMNVVIEIIKSG